MNRKGNIVVDEEIIDKIISVAYKDAKLSDKISIYRLAKKNEHIKHLLESYKATANEVHKLHEEEPPNDILHSIKLKSIPAGEDKNMFLTDLLNIIYTRPIISVLTTIILIAMLVVAVVQNKHTEFQYSQAELQIADQKARHALAVVGKIFSETQSALQEEILIKKVGKPLNESFELINNLLIQGGKQ